MFPGRLPTFPPTSFVYVATSLFTFYFSQRQNHAHQSPKYFEGIYEPSSTEKPMKSRESNPHDLQPKGPRHITTSAETVDNFFFHRQTIAKQKKAFFRRRRVRILIPIPLLFFCLHAGGLITTRPPIQGPFILWTLATNLRPFSSPFSSARNLAMH